MVKLVSAEQIAEEIEDVLPRATRENGGVVVELPEAWVASFNNGKKRTESPSSIVSYLQCPLRWFIDRHAPFERIKAPTRWTVLGTFVHRVLEVFYSEPAPMRNQKLLLETYEYALELLEAGDTTDGLIDPSLSEDYKIVLKTDRYANTVIKYIRSRSREIIEGYLDNFEPDPENVEIISNETWVRGETENGVKIQGKIDRVILDEDGNEIVEDYKTGKKVGITKNFEGPRIFEKTLVPAGIYAWLRMEMTRKELIPSKVTSVRLLYIGAEPEPERVNVGINANTINRISALINRITVEMDTLVNTQQEIIAIPAQAEGDRRGYCDYCPILKWCPAWTSSESLDDVVNNCSTIIR